MAEHTNSDERREELTRRQTLMSELVTLGGPVGVSTEDIRRLRIYRGQAGIWRDIDITRPLTTDGHGVAVALLPIGRIYPDDLDGDVLLYHYPSTDRSGQDDPEIAATKNAARLRLPLFVVTRSEQRPSLRDVRFGWVLEWDDTLREFLVSITDAEPAPRDSREPAEPIILDADRPLTTREIERRERSPKFRFEVLHRYGPRCAVCAIARPELLDAAHIVTVASHGSDNPANGLPLCASHHRAFDRGLFHIDPDSLAIAYPRGVSPEDLGIQRSSIEHLTPAPDADALRIRVTNAEPIVGVLPRR